MSAVTRETNDHFIQKHKDTSMCKCTSLIVRHELICTMIDVIHVYECIVT